MNKLFFTAILFGSLVTSLQAQTLFTYGKYKADAKEFLHAFSKNNSQPAQANKAKAIKDYLDLYIKSKLKTREAYDRKYDTLSQLKNDVENLRAQIIDNYLADTEVGDKLVKEAFQRSLKDIRVAHIFISFRKNDFTVDTAAAEKKLNEVMKRLQQGEDFLTVAQQWSDDPAAKENKGEIGYITVLTLPYEFETVVYHTPVGKYSAPYRSKAGYHIFKNMGERPSAGKMKARQILLAFPPGADEATKKEIARKADSLYERIMAGDDFGKLAEEFSNDYTTSVSGGLMPEFSVGRYDAAFENAVWSLPKDEAVSKPFMTTHGYHIVKRISITPPVTDPENKNYMLDLRQRVMNDGRWQLTKDAIFNQVVKQAGFKKFPYEEAPLWALTDSLIDRTPLGIGNKMKADAPLFKVGDSTFTVPNWVSYAQLFRFKQDGTGRKPYAQVMDEFVHHAALQYYRDHLENFNEEFRYQMNEFRDGNLFFEIMQREIWNKAQADSGALALLYAKNKTKYMWKQSADAVIFFCADTIIAHNIYEQVKKDPSHWQKVAEAFAEKVVADSARYEWSQMPVKASSEYKDNTVTSLQVNETDNTASFAYIIRTYPQPAQRSYAEARGLLINDYQDILEAKWMQRLKQKYPVVINQKVLADISK